jgi:hypothetical protein
LVGVFLGLSKKEGEKKNKGAKASASPASRVQGKKKTRSVVQNGTVWVFFIYLFLKQWMKRCRFTQNTPFHLKGNGGKIVPKSTSVLNL